MSRKLMDVWEGNVRIFFNFMHDGHKYTLGYPKNHVKLDDVWMGEDGVEIGRVSYAEAAGLIGQGLAQSVLPLLKSHGAKAIGLEGSQRMLAVRNSFAQDPYEFEPSLTGNRTGHCLVCGKKLHGNTSKSHCTECYYKYIA